MGGIEHLQKSTDVSFTQLETDIGGRRSEGSLALMTLPEYVEHQDGVSRAGALSAEAVLRDYEVAAKEIEAMGAELIDAAKKCQAMTAEVHTAIAYMRGTAAAGQVHAKTGLVEHVNSLSGYATTRRGAHLIFAIFGNNTGTHGPEALHAVDAICVAMVEELAPHRETRAARSGINPRPAGGDPEPSAETNLPVK